MNVGDRVIVGDHIREVEHKRLARPEAAGKHGVITENDGWGLCRVKLDDGTIIQAWNGCDLTAEQRDPTHKLIVTVPIHDEGPLAGREQQEALQEALRVILPVIKLGTLGLLCDDGVTVDVVRCG